MLRIVDYVQIANDVYGTSKKPINTLTQEQVSKKNKIQNGLYRIPEAGINLSPTNDFYAQLYVNFSKCEKFYSLSLTTCINYTHHETGKVTKNESI